MNREPNEAPVAVAPAPAKPNYHRLGLLQPRMFRIERADGRPIDESAQMFLLRYDKPGFWGDAARKVLLDFCDAIEERYPKLAPDLRASVLKEQERIELLIVPAQQPPLERALDEEIPT